MVSAARTLRSVIALVILSVLCHPPLFRLTFKRPG